MSGPKALLLAAALMAPLTACSQQPEPSVDQEQANAIANAGAEIEDVADDSLVATDGAANDSESLDAGDDVPGNAD